MQFRIYRANNNHSMIDLFGCILLTALVVNGINIAAGEGMILYSLKCWLKKKLTNRCKSNEPHPIYKPLIACVKCMPSIYGTAICFLLLPLNIHLVYLIPIVILSSSTVASIIHSLYL